MGSIFVKKDDFEIRIEGEIFNKNSATQKSKLQPHVAKLIDDLTEKFSNFGHMKTKNLSE